MGEERTPREHPEVDAADIAIVGMAGRFPGARDVDELWQNVRAKVESIRPVSEDELAAAGLDPALARDPSFVRAVSELDDIEGFDASFFDMPPREAEVTDPQHRVFLECAWTALEHAGYAPRDCPGRVGVFGGAMLNTYLLFHVARSRGAIESMHPLQLNVGNGADFIATRVSYKLNLRGPSHSVQSACSTSLVAVHVACQSLLNDECDMALAGGVAINLGQRHGYPHVAGGMASPDGHCRAFDARAEGTIFGSGGGVVVLKALRAALADGDTVYAIIKGSAINNDGSRKAGYTAPSVEGQASAIAEAIAAAGVTADTIGCVEAHGTGTPLGDPIEVLALTRAFRIDTARNAYCALGSVKTNVGHLDAGAGVTGLVKTVQALRHREIPPSLHFTQQNPAIDFASSPFYVSTELRPWPRGSTPRRAGVSAFGVGGTNAHVVLEEAPPPSASSPSRASQIIVLSARTASALDAAAARLAAHLEDCPLDEPSGNFPDVAHTLQIGRQRFAHRRFVVSRTRADAARSLREPLSPAEREAAAARTDRPIAFLFPGQGAQRAGMAARIYATEPAFRDDVDRCAEILRPHLGIDLRDVLYPSARAGAAAGSADDAAGDALAPTAVAQPALFAIEYALAQLWISWGVVPDAMLGHSVGEYVAACIAGVFDLDGALAIVAARGRLMQALPPGAMLAVPLSEDEIAPYLRDDLTLSAVNADDQCVVAGPPRAVDEAVERLISAGIGARRLATGHAFHSPMMTPAAAELTAIVRDAKPRAPTRPFLSNVTGTWITAADATRAEYWGSDHLTKPVRFADGLTALAADDRRALLEVGPGRTLTRLAQRHPAATAARDRAIAASLPGGGADEGGDMELLTALGAMWRAGAAIDWRGFGRGERRRRVGIPTYPFERKRFWIEPDDSVARTTTPAMTPDTRAETVAARDLANTPGVASSALEPKDTAIFASRSDVRPLHPRPPGLRSRYVAPRSALERSLATFWEQALGVGPIGAQDSFFELGGDSLTAVQLGTRIHGALGVEVPTVSLYEGLTIESLAKLIDAAKEPEANDETLDAPANDTPRGSDIAIVGIACRFPGARDERAFWRNLRDGVESITFFDGDLEPSAIEDPAVRRDPSYVRAAPILDDVDAFDSAFFGVTPKEAALMDPQHRLFLECSWEALENAGYAPDRVKERVGVFGGSRTNTYVFNLLSNPAALGSLGAFEVGLGNDFAFLSSRVAHRLNLRGPAFSVHTACSTGLVAVHLAARALLAGECRMALAGGVAVNVPHRAGYLYQPGNVTSPDGHCRAFDAKAAGTVFGSGVGVVLLKRLEDAIAGGDTVRAVIRGSAINNDGSEKASFTAPSVKGQARVIRDALASAGVDARSVTYVEAHGTGTALGDPIEVKALTRAFRKTTDDKAFCALGSVKTNVGHLDAAAGMASLIKAVLALEHREIPATLHFESPNPLMEIDDSPFFVNAASRAWTTDRLPRRAGVSSFGVGGTNAHVIVEEAPRIAARAASSGATSDTGAPNAGATSDIGAEATAWQVLLLSAKTEEALDAMTGSLADAIEDRAEGPLADIAHTLQVGRTFFDHRRAVVCRDHDGAVRALRGGDPSRVHAALTDVEARPVAFLFPGTGAHYPGMCAGLYATEPVFRAEVARLADILGPLDHRVDLRAVFGSNSAPDLDLAAVAMPAIFVVEIALARLFASWGIEPKIMLGHSLGEYAAAHLAGVMSLEDAAALVALRGALVDTLPEGAMLSVGLPERDIAPLLVNADLALAAVNAPAQCVVSGRVDAIEAFAARLAADGVDCRRLHVRRALHSPMLDPVLPRFRERLARVTLHAPQIPFVSSLTGRIAGDDVTRPDFWVAQLRDVVRFADGMREVLSDPARALVEVGPGHALTALARVQGEPAAARIAIPSTRHAKDTPSDESFTRTTLAKLWLAGVDVRWEATHAAPRRKVPLPTYPFERTRYWVLPGPSPNAGATQAHGKSLDIARWFHLPSWRPTPPIPISPTTFSEPRGWVLFTDGGPLASALATRLEHDGQDVTLVEDGEAFATDGARRFTIAAAEPEHYDRLFDAIRERPGAARAEVFVHFWSMTDEADDASSRSVSSADESSADVSSEARFRALLPRGYASVMLLGQALARTSGTEPLRLEIVSNRVHDVDGGPPALPEKTPMLGVCKVLPQEHQHIATRCVDVVAPRADRDGARLAAQLAAEVAARSPDMIVAYRGGRRLVQSFAPARLEAGAPAVRALRDRGVYVITGGLGGVGMLMAEHLATAHRARLALLGRTPLPPRDAWDRWIAEHGESDRTSRIILRIRAMETSGAEVMTVAADVAHLAQLQRALARVDARFGAIHGVLHAAGITSGDSIYRAVAEVTPAASEAQFRPKVHGTYALEAALAGRDPDLDFVALFSSNAATLGGLGYVTYAAANGFMDAFATSRSRRGDSRWVSIDWDPWPEETKHHEGARTSMDRYTMTLDESVEAFRRVVTQGLDGQVVAATGDLEGRLARWIHRTEKTVATKGARTSRGTYAAPENDDERALAAIWHEVLGGGPIGRDDDFFDLGGHSLLATQIMSRMRATFRVEVPFATLFEAPTVAGLARAVATVRDERRIAEPGQEHDAAQRALHGQIASEPIPRRQRPMDIAPMTFGQRRFWFLDQLEPGTAAYNLSWALRLSGPIDVAAFAHAFRALVDRHEGLRTTFETLDGEPVQRVHEAMDVPLPVIDLPARADEDVDEDAVETEIRRRALDEAQAPFDLARGPLLRTTLLRAGDDEHVLVLTMHHIAGDGWSLGVLVRELTAIYDARRRGRDASLPELPIQVADHAAWQQSARKAAELDRQLAYWKTALAGIPPLELPCDRPRSASPSRRGGEIVFDVPESIAEDLRALGRREGATLFMVLLAAFYAVIHRWSHADDIAIGSPIAGRTRQELEGLIGLFLNTLVLRAIVSRSDRFVDLLARVKSTTVEAYEHQDLPFERLVEHLAPARELARAPLFQVLFIVQNAPFEPARLEGLAIEPLHVHGGTSALDLTLSMTEQEDGDVRGLLEYATDLFDRGTAERLAERFVALLGAVAADPSARIGSLPILTAAERASLARWNDTGPARGEPSCVHALFEAQVDRTPRATAVVHGARELTYDALDRRANQLAHHLRALGCGPESRVGVCVTRGAEMLVALMGVLKAGAAYVPLDPAYPTDRLAYMLADSGAKVAIVDRLSAASLPHASARAGCAVVSLDDAASLLAAQRDDRPVSFALPDHLMYVIYTSGSTGRPKGVAIAHRSVSALLGWARDEFSTDEMAYVLAGTSASFDISVFEMFAPLAVGGAVVVARDVLALAEMPRDARVTLVDTVPSAAAELVEMQPWPSAVQTVTLVGEPLTWRLGHALLSQPQITKLYNLYGPTEDTVYSTFIRFARGEGRAKAPSPPSPAPSPSPAPALSPPSSAPPAPVIGRPIPGTRAYVLSDDLAEMPIGAIGELYLAGAGLARGYLDRPELTADRFVPDPIAREPGARMYRTGDLARWLAGGHLDYVGRTDHQVKVRGHRIELGEIEAALARERGVREAVVTAREDRPGDKRLVAYLLGEPSDIDVPSLRPSLARRLPDYMIPSAYVVLAAWPRSPNAKLDRRALPAPPDASTETNGRAARDPRPGTPDEELLATAFAEVLGVARVAIHDDFFAIGGHSLLATRLVARIRRDLGVELPLRLLFETPTVAGLAERLGELVRDDTPPLVRVPRDGPLPLSLGQHRMWLLDQLMPGTSHFTMRFALRIEGALDVEALRAAFDDVARRHESIRTTFHAGEGAPVQRVHAPSPWVLPVVDLSGMPATERYATALGRADEEARRPFDLTIGPLLRSMLVALGPAEHVLILTMHHIIGDGWSTGVLVRDLAECYDARRSGRPPSLPDLPIQVADHAAWQRRRLTPEARAELLGYWAEKLAGVAWLELPEDHPPSAESPRAEAPVQIDAELAAASTALARREGVTLFMVLVAAFQAVLHAWSGRGDIAIGTHVAGRDRAELEGLIGFFVSTVVLRVDVSRCRTYRDLLAAAKDATLGAHAHQEMLREEAASKERYHEGQIPLRAMFLLEAAPIDVVRIEGLTIAPIQGDNDGGLELTLSLREDGERLEGSLGFAADLFERATMARVIERLVATLRAMVADPAAPLAGPGAA